MVQQLNETWAQGSRPGDPPISSVAVAVDPRWLANQDARQRLLAFVRAPRPANVASGLLHDLLTVLELDA